MRDATGIQCMEIIQEQISTHAPHAGRDRDKGLLKYIAEIFTHAPHAGRDAVYHSIKDGTDEFLLTRPMRDATF